MPIYVRQFVNSITHIEGCPGRRCGPGCVRETNGWEYHIKLVLPNGQFVEERKKSPLTSKTATQRYAQERANFLIRESLAPMVKKDSTVETATTWDEFWRRYIDEHCRANRLKPSTIAQKETIYSYYLKSRFGSTPLSETTDSAIAKLKADLADLKPKTVNNILVTLSTVLKVAKEWGVIAHIPCTIKLLKTTVPTVEFYEPAEFENLVAAAEQIDPRIALLVLLGGEAGLRRGEIIALDQTDCDVKRGLLHVRRSEWKGQVTAPKGGRERQVNMTDRLKAALIRNRHLRGDRVLWRDDGLEKVTAVLLAKWMRRAQKRAGLKATGNLHILRHTFCSRLAMAGATTLAIKELAGHTSITTTMRYMHLSPAAKSAAIELLNKEVSGDIRETTQGLQKNP